MKKYILKTLLFGFPFFLIFTLIVIKLSSRSFFRTLIAEDGIVELGQVFFYLLASTFFLITAIRLFRVGKKDSSLIFLVLFLGLVLVCAEEISWGQRIMGLESPEYFTRHNLQKELTIHNMSMIQPFLNLAYSLIGLIGAAGWAVLKLSGKKQWRDLVPGWYLSSYFAPIVIISVYHEISYHLGGAMAGPGFPEQVRFFDWKDQEVTELLLAMGFFLFSYAASKQASSFNRGKN